MSEQEQQPESTPSVNDALSAAARKSGFGKVAASETLDGAAIISAIGGVRGLIESGLPSFLFVVVYLISKDVLISSLVPVGVAVIFIVVRAATKLPITPAVTGAVFVAITAVLAISTDRASNNFVIGLGLNAVYGVVVLVSILVRRPVIGIIVGLLLGERAAGWRDDTKQYRALIGLTWLWVGLFALRLAVELPLYLSDNAAALGVAKLILGVPLYAVVLWVTWLFVRSIYPPQTPAVVEPGTAVDEPAE